MHGEDTGVSPRYHRDITSDPVPELEGASWLLSRAPPGAEAVLRVQHEESDAMAKAAAGGGADGSVADQLRKLGVKGVLVQMAERGQLLALKCEMPQCYHHKGRAAFDQVTTPRTKWAPSPDHYPILKSAGGQLRPENVRLSHIWCNNRDYGWRMQIRTLLAKGKSLAEIADALNTKDVPPAHGTNRWTAAMVRKAYVS